MNRRQWLTSVGLLGFGLCTRAGAAEIHMMEPTEAIALEHQTRSSRLRRLVREYGVGPAPDFYEYVVPARLMPPDFKYDTPVLRVVFPESTFFDTARAEILPSAIPIIAAMARTLDGDVPDVATFVAGHADNRGSEAYNYGLSVDRARAVALALRRAGANAPDIWSVGFGESLPLYENSDPLNMSYNRRVEFLFAARPEAAASWLKDQMDFACSRSDEAGKARCLVTLRLRPSYVVEAVERQVVAPAPQVRNRVVRPTSRVAVVQAPRRRQIVINLAERSYVVTKPEH